ncbi:MAG TPA: GIDE domain-containing protein [Candidatus Acidoferrum sp.]|nr:GIDE domain-containing protein [Candidatus Acidoferrum sp.]
MLLALVTLTAAVDTSTNTAKLEFWAAIGAVLGVVLFVRGFLMLRFKRQIMNTPASKIRSASVGLVEISGMAKGPTTIPAGITGEACYYYRATAWELRESGRNREWKQVANESVYVPFFVEDPTGRLLINPQGADLDIHCNFKDEFDTSFFRSNREMLPENVARFLVRNGISFSESIRLEEYCIKPDYPLFVFGTLGKNSDSATWAPVPHVASGSSLNSRLSLFGSSGGGMFAPLGGLSGFSGTFSAGARPTIGARATTRTSAAPKPAPTSSWSAVSMDDVPAGHRVASPAQAPSPARALQTSSIRASAPVATVDPGSAPDGSPANSPAEDGGFDPHPSVCISKGPNHDPFMVSWRSQREVVQSLAWKSALCIWGGPALTLACLYFLALSFGWT